MENRSVHTLTIDGGWLCLDFVNTVSDRTESAPFDYLASFDHVVDWAKRMEIIAVKEASTLLQRSSLEKAKTWIKTIELREALFRTFRALINNSSPPPSDQKLLNGWFARAFKCFSLEYENNGTVRPQFGNRHDIHFINYRIADSAYQLLTSDRLSRVKLCSSCEWLFLDTTKNGSRKWCRMETCGSQAKAKSYYHRQKKKSSRDVE